MEKIYLSENKRSFFSNRMPKPNTNNQDNLNFVLGINYRSLLMLEELISNYSREISAFKKEKYSNLNNFYYHITEINFLFSEKLQDDSLLKSIIMPTINLQVISLIISIIPFNLRKDKIIISQKNSILSIISKVNQSFLCILKFIIDICQNEKLTNITFNTIQTIILSNAKFPIKPQKSLFSSIAKLNDIIFNDLIIFTGKNKNIFTRNITYYIKHYRSLSYRSVIKLLEKYCDKSIRPRTPESEISSCTECIKYPFLPEPLGKNIALTVVLDLDDTLINFVMGPCNSKGMLRIRPGFVEFLEKIKNLKCEIVLFTAATQDVIKIKMM